MVDLEELSDSELKELEEEFRNIYKKELEKRQLTKPPQKL